MIMVQGRDSPRLGCSRTHVMPSVMETDSRLCPACMSERTTQGARASVRCMVCGTVWVPSRRNYVYDDSYPQDRAHGEGEVARAKQVTLRAWLGKLSASVAGKAVLEVGFGAGSTLGLVDSLGGIAHGVEPVAANRAAAVRTGIAADRIKSDLPGFAGHRFDALLYLDSFEHLIDPSDHLDQLAGMTSAGAEALLVLPISGTVSQALLGKLWPHDIQDHWVFYSGTGLTGLWARHGWDCTRQFYPWKYVSARTIALHWEIKTGLKASYLSNRSFGIWLNFGEGGFVFRRRP